MNKATREAIEDLRLLVFCKSEYAALTTVLDAIRTLEQEKREMFKKLCKYCVHSQTSPMHPAYYCGRTLSIRPSRSTCPLLGKKGKK